MTSITRALVQGLRPQANISTLLRGAWLENPGLAIQLSARFQSAKLYDDVRELLLNFPEKALDEPDALRILLGSSLPFDVTFQLKVSCITNGRSLR